MPSLDDLPLELRQKIYSLALIKPGDITVRRGVSTSNHHVASFIRDAGPELVPVVYSALFQVSKQVRADALALFCSNNKFNFASSASLELFLNQIGPSRRHLRHVKILMRGYEHDSSKSPGATRRAFGLLVMSTGLQSLTVSHMDFCHWNADGEAKAKLKQTNFLEACVPLLQILDWARKGGMKRSVLDIVKFEIPECKGCASAGCKFPGRQMPKRRVVLNPDVPRGFGSRVRCGCLCSEADGSNDALNEQFRNRLAEKLGLDD